MHAYKHSEKQLTKITSDCLIHLLWQPGMWLERAGDSWPVNCIYFYPKLIIFDINKIWWINKYSIKYWSIVSHHLPVHLAPPPPSPQLSRSPNVFYILSKSALQGGVSSNGYKSLKRRHFCIQCVNGTCGAPTGNMLKKYVAPPVVTTRTKRTPLHRYLDPPLCRECIFQ